MTFPVKIQTPFGEKQFTILNQQYQYYKKNGFLDEFVARCNVDFQTQQAYLYHFLDDEKLSVKYKMNEDDMDGWNFFQQQNDLCSILSYFSERAHNDSISSSS